MIGSLIDTEIVSDLRTQTEDSLFAILPQLNREFLSNDSIFSGNIGYLLYASYFYKYLDMPHWGENALEVFDNIFGKIASGQNQLYGSSLAGGFSGLAMALHLMQKEEIGDFEEQMSFFDKIIFEDCLKEIQKQNTDYLYGAAGVINYFAKRKAHTYLTVLTNRIIEDLTHTHNNHIYFPNSHLQRMFANSSEVDLGLSHGLCGVLLALLEAYKLGLNNSESIADSIKKGISFLLSLRNNNEYQYSFFPVKHNLIKDITSPENQRFYSNKLGWCYGDLNHILLLYKAGFVLKNNDWIAEADEIGEKVVKRLSVEETDIEDSHFCHGASGVAQFYKNLYEISENDLYKEAYHVWIQKTIDFAEKDILIYTPERKSELLMGLGATSLVLLGYLYPESTSWDSIFLLS